MSIVAELVPYYCMSDLVIVLYTGLLRSTVEEAANIPATVPDSKNQGVIAYEFLDRSELNMYIDDDVVVDIREHIHNAVRHAEGSAYIVLGEPGSDQRRISCLQAEKWE